MSEAANFRPRAEKAAQPPDLRYSATPFEQLARIGCHLFDVDFCAALLPDEQHWIRSIGEILDREALGSSGFYRRFDQNGAILVPDAAAFAALKSNILVSRDPGIRLVIYSHLVASDMKSTLDVFLADREPCVWTDQRVSLLGDFLAICGEVLNSGLRERALLDLIEENKQLHRLATVDHLTGLWNRDSILDILDRELERCFREQLPISVIVADLDYFKSVNDRYGHLVGDVVLEEVGRRLRRAVRTYDAVGRVGGEEFLIVMSNCEELIAASVAERIHDAIRSDPMPTGEVRVSLTISQGLVTYSGEKRMSSIELFDKADKALYMAKAKGRDGIQQNMESR